MSVESVTLQNTSNLISNKQVLSVYVIYKLFNKYVLIFTKRVVLLRNR